MTAMTSSVLPPTPGQTVGPFFGFALPFERGSQLVAPGTPGAIRLHGRVLDGRGQPVPDAMLEIWQADADGVLSREQGSLVRDGWSFTGWGRAATDSDGRYDFTTVTPGATRPGAAPFILVAVFARGLLDRLFTRIYVPDDDRLADDPLLCSLTDDRRRTLIATRDDAGLCFDIRLQGDDEHGETVFLRYPGH